MIGLCLSGAMLTAQFGDVLNALDSVVWNLIQFVLALFAQNHGVHYVASNAYWSTTIKALTPLIMHVAFGVLLLSKKDRNTGMPFVHHRRELLALAAATWVIGFYATDWVSSGPLAPFFSHGSGVAMAIFFAITVFV